MKLSGGQKARVIFTSIALSEPHILLLDEPTNHLDMQSIDALSEALDAFDGGVVIISHDSRLLATICSDEEHSEVWDVQDGVVRRYDSDFEDYKEELMEAIREEFAEEDEEQGRMTMGSR
jgi:ATP-binding cassette subfamily F protein 1